MTGKTAMSGCTLLSLPGTAGRWALLAALLLASMSPHAAAPPPSGAASGLVSYAEGSPFTLIRGDELRTGSRGVTLMAGDIVETGPDDFLVLQMQSGTLVGIGPGSSVYFTERGGALRLLVREGWVKADFRAPAASGPHGLLAASRVAIQCQQDVVVLHASASREEIFDEQGEGTLAAYGSARPHTDPQMRAGQLITSDSRMEVVVTPRPSADFLEQMPKPFRDSLPPAEEATAAPAPAPELLRKVNYADVEGWLNAQADWRDGFIPRFRGRLKDPAFFAAMDAHLAQHPEWTLVLHPPPPPLRMDPRRSAGNQASHGAQPADGEVPDVDQGDAAAAQQPAGAPSAAPRPQGDHPPDGPRPQSNASSNPSSSLSSSLSSNASASASSNASSEGRRPQH